MNPYYPEEYAIVEKPLREKLRDDRFEDLEVRK